LLSYALTILDEGFVRLDIVKAIRGTHDNSPKEPFKARESMHRPS
jgi:hypothetical protein